MRWGVAERDFSKADGGCTKMAENDKGEVAGARREDASQRDSSMRVPMAKRRQMEQKRVWVDK